MLLILGYDEEKSAASGDLGQTNITVRIGSSKPSYIQGEVVALDVVVTNDGQSDVILRGADVESGFLKVFVSGEDQKFKQYSHSAWVHGRREGIFIKSGQSIKSQANLLWSFSPRGRVADLSRVKDSLIITDLAFPEAGVYFLKAELIIPGELQTRIESNPVQIVISAPVGDDLRVWNELKKNPEIAYFLQEGQVRAAKVEEREKQLNEVERIVRENPNSSLTQQLEGSLQKFRESEAKRKQFLEKLKKQQSLQN